MTRTDDYAAVVAFHGHECPGAALGVRMAEAAGSRIGRHEPGNELMALAETDICSVDSIQVLTGCTFGKRNLRHADNGKNAFTFWRRGSEHGVRVIAKLGGDAFRDADTWAMADKIDDGTADEEDRRRFAERQQARIVRILDAPIDELLAIETVEGPPPSKPLVHRSETCAECHEPTSVSALHNHRGSMICPPCHLRAHGGQLPPEHGADHRHPLMQEGHHHHH